MERITTSNKRIYDMNSSEFNKITSKTELADKNSILNYLRNTPRTAFTSQPVYDKITGDIVFEADNEHNDGEYYWFEEDIYHFEKYNIKLSDEFISHVLNNVKN